MQSVESKYCTDMSQWDFIWGGIKNYSAVSGAAFDSCHGFWTDTAQQAVISYTSSLLALGDDYS